MVQSAASLSRLYITGTEPPTAIPVKPRSRISCQGQLTKRMVAPEGS